jgi:flagellar biosynthesis component FlhA
MILKSLLKDGIGIRHFDIILQAISENGPKALTERMLLEEIRIAMKRVISSKVSLAGIVKGYTIDPVFDVLLTQCERNSKEVPARHLLSVISAIKELKLDKDAILLVSRGGRRLLGEVLATKGIVARAIAYEEISEGITIQKLGEISLSTEQADDVIMELAA